MHAIIDYFAWITIGLVLLAVLFGIGLAYILIDEGLRALIRRLRETPAAVHDPSQAYTARHAATISEPAELVETLHVAPRRRVIPAIGTRSRLQAVKSQMYLHLHIKQHKHANAKP